MTIEQTMTELQAKLANINIGMMSLKTDAEAMLKRIAIMQEMMGGIVIPVPVPQPPAQPSVSEPFIDLSRFKLTLPVNEVGELSGKAAEILDPQRMLGNQWMHRNPGGSITLTCSDGGATTATAKYARTEFRGLAEFGFDQNATDNRTFTVDALPNGHKVVVGQIHDKEEPWVKMVFGNGKLRALVKVRDGAPDTEIVLLDGAKVGDKIDYTLQYEPGILTILCCGGKHTVPMFRTGAGGKAYFKWGNYYQNADRIGNECRVTFYP